MDGSEPMHVFRRTWLTMGLALWLCAGVASDALACPMCQLAAESDDRLPRAYMYSILFMLCVPATIATGFGVSLYRLSKKGRLSSDLDTTETQAMDPETGGVAGGPPADSEPHSDGGRSS